MDIRLDPVEARVIGSLMEKEITTPDHYPLSLNALVNACNQKTNRDPVMNLSDSEVQAALDRLHAKHLVLDRSGFGSRVVKYKQRFCNTEFGSMRFSPGETAIVCLLLLRGPQTPGELRSRSGRLHSFADLGEVEECLQSLRRRDDDPLVAALPREPGRREIRWTHLFSGDVEHSEPAVRPAAVGATPTTPVADADDEILTRVSQLEEQVSQLLARVKELEGRDD